MVGLSNANMTPWLCARDVEEDVLEQKLNTLAGMIQQSRADHRCPACPALWILVWTPALNWIKT